MIRLPICLVIFLLFAIAGNAADIYVSPKGSDTNNGSKDQPLVTVQAALRKAREMRRLNDASVIGGVHIFLMDGKYQLTETIILRPEDSGNESNPTFIEAAPGARPVLSGGIEIRGWKKLGVVLPGLPAVAKGHIWVADVPMVNGRLFEFRQLWVNDVKAIRAKSVNGDAMHRILNWNKQEAACVIPTLSFLNLD